MALYYPTTARLVPIVKQLLLHLPGSFSCLFFMFSVLFFGSLSFVSLHQVTLSSFSEQQAMALQRRAMSLLTETQPSFVESLVNIYQLNSLDPAILRLHIVRLQALNCYKEVSALFDVNTISYGRKISDKNVESHVNAETTFCFSQAAVLSIKLKLQKELNMEEVGQNTSADMS